MRTLPVLLTGAVLISALAACSQSSTTAPTQAPAPTVVPITVSGSNPPMCIFDMAGQPPDKEPYGVTSVLKDGVMAKKAAGGVVRFFMKGEYTQYACWALGEEKLTALFGAETAATVLQHTPAGQPQPPLPRQATPTAVLASKANQPTTANTAPMSAPSNNNWRLIIVGVLAVIAVLSVVARRLRPTQPEEEEEIAVPPFVREPEPVPPPVTVAATPPPNIIGGPVPPVTQPVPLTPVPPVTAAATAPVSAAVVDPSKAQLERIIPLLPAFIRGQLARNQNYTRSKLVTWLKNDSGLDEGLEPQTTGLVKTYLEDEGLIEKSQGGSGADFTDKARQLYGPADDLLAPLEQPVTPPAQEAPTTPIAPLSPLPPATGPARTRLLRRLANPDEPIDQAG